MARSKTYDEIVGNDNSKERPSGADSSTVHNDTNANNTGNPHDTGSETGAVGIEVPLPKLAVIKGKAETSSVAAAPKSLSYAEMIQKFSPHKPPTAEELEAERKREKREKMWAAIGDGLSAISNLVFAPMSGYSNYKSNNSMSEKAKERWDKLHKERKDNDEKYFKLYMQAQKQDDENNRWRISMEQNRQKAEREQQRWREQFNYKKERDKKEDGYKDAEQKRRDDELEWKKEEAGKKREAADKQFKEKVRQFNQTLKINKVKSDAAKAKNQKVFFVNDETITISNDALNPETVSALYHTLPEDIRSNAEKSIGEPIYDSRKRKVVGYKPLTADQMLMAIGIGINDSPGTQYRLRILAGQKPQKPKKDFSGNIVSTEEDYEQYAEK